MTTLAELKRLAEGATPGQWNWSDHLPGCTSRSYCCCVGAFYSLPGGECMCHFGDAETYYPSNGIPPNEADKNFIAAANPATVLKLIAVVEAGKRVMMTTAHRDISPYYEVFEETAPAFRELEVALAALDQPSQEGG